MMSADELANALIDAIADSIEPTSDDRLLLIVNGMGGTPLLELYLLYDAVSRVCTDKGLQIVRSLVGNYCTSLEMAGASVTLTKMDDDALALWDAPVNTAALRWGT